MSAAADAPDDRESRPSASQASEPDDAPSCPEAGDPGRESPPGREAAERAPCHLERGVDASRLRQESPVADGDSATANAQKPGCDADVVVQCAAGYCPTTRGLQAAIEKKLAKLCEDGALRPGGKAQVTMEDVVDNVDAGQAAEQRLESVAAAKGLEEV